MVISRNGMLLGETSEKVVLDALDHREDIEIYGVEQFKESLLEEWFDYCAVQRFNND